MNATSGRRGKQVGTRFEYAVKGALERRGYTVMRSPASKSPADLWAVMNGKVAFIQCKLHGVISWAEWNGFLDYCKGAGVPAILARRPDGKTRGFVFEEITGYRKRGQRKPFPCKVRDMDIL